MTYKYMAIESQIIDTHTEAILLHRLLEIAKEAGYTHVQDHWGYKAYDEYTIDEALVVFLPKPPLEEPSEDEWFNDYTGKWVKRTPAEEKPDSTGFVPGTPNHDAALIAAHG